MNTNGFRLLTILVVGAADATKRFEAAGLEPPAFSRLATFNVAFVADPDGNTIELVALDDDPGPAGISGFQVGLTVSDAERARQFYGHVLGLTERPAMPMPASLAANTTQYMYRASSAMIKFWAPPTERSSTPSEVTKALGIRYIVLKVDDVASAREALRSRGISPRLQTSQRLSLIDPDGNAVEITALRSTVQ
jgi:catechol 2,3-dioxygenase-like lactoylglutathione lyase family enzyme